MCARIEEFDRNVKRIDGNKLLQRVLKVVLTLRVSHTILYPRNISLGSLDERNILPAPTKERNVLLGIYPHPGSRGDTPGLRGKV